MNPMVGAIKSRLPWWAKIGAKLVLSRLPAAYGIWQRLGLFRHGYMDTAQYALGVFSSHVERAGLAGRLAGKTVLELGPGDSVATALIAKAFGARAILVDAGAFARPDIAAYRPLADALRTAGLAPPPLDNVKTLDDLLAACDASYLTQGLASLRAIADESVDLVFSQAVLEHVRKHEFLETQRALGIAVFRRGRVLYESDRFRWDAAGVRAGGFSDASHRGAALGQTPHRSPPSRR